MSVTIDDYIDAIIEHITDRFAGVLQTVDDSLPDSADHQAPINTPAALIDIEMGGEGPDLGDDRDPLQVNMTIHCLLSNETPNVRREVRKFAAQMYQLVRGNRWELHGVSRPESITIGPGEFKRGKKGYESWYCNFDQNIYLGESAFDGTAFAPREVYLGLSPNVGEGGDYEQA